MNTYSGIRVFRPWIKVRFAHSPSSGLHSKPPKNEPAPVQDKASEDSTEQVRTKPRRGSPEHRAILSEIMKRQWTQPGFREAVQEYWSDPERRALTSESMKDMWAQPGFREKRRAAMREAYSSLSPELKAKRSAALREGYLNMSPESKEKRAAAVREAWSNMSPEAREKHADGVREGWLNLSPEEREKRMASQREGWSPEVKEKAAAMARKSWSTRPEDKVKFGARTIALWKIPEKKDALLRHRLFRRDDNDPKMKMMWEKMKKEAKTFADSLNADELRVQYHNAFGKF